MTMKPNLLALASLLTALFASSLAQAQTPAPPPSVLVQNKYYPKPGQEDAVLATRLEASAVRKSLGLPEGVVLLRRNEATGAPLVIWECEYPSIEARRADAAAAESAPSFAAVQKKMGGLTERFERRTWTLRAP
jgi:hypothetical protein